MTRRLTTRKRVLYAALANAVGFGALFVVGELVTRWHLEGGVRAAIRSFYTTRLTADRTHAEGWLAYDEVLGYKLNPELPGANSLGIGHGEISDVKPSGLFRVLILGDSIAWDRGRVLGLPEGSRGFVTQVQERFGSLRTGPVDVINAAIPGYTTYQERTLFERDLARFAPDLVILQYCLNDNHRFLHMLNLTGRWLVTPEAERAMLPEGQGWLTSFVRSSYLLMELRVRLSGLQKRAAGRFPWDSNMDMAPAWQDQTWSDFAGHLQAIRDHLIRSGGRLAVVAVPLEAQLDQALLDRDTAYTVKPQRRLAEVCERLGVPLLDLHPAFLANRDRRLYDDGIHLTASGHAVAADQILEFLQARHLAN
jgi:lysophospholipase L1-like esterase